MLRRWIRQARGNAQLAAVLGRLRTIVAAYLSASLASGFVVALGFLLRALANMLYDGEWQDAAAYTLTGPIWLFGFGFGISLFVAVFALVPAIFAIGFAEAARIRSAAFYGCAGALAAGVAFYLFTIGDQDFYRPPHLWWPLSVADVALALLILGGGVVGGLVYWLIAWTRAGDWRAPVTKVAADTDAR
jgi:hypothetical protein